MNDISCAGGKEGVFITEAPQHCHAIDAGVPCGNNIDIRIPEQDGVGLVNVHRFKNGANHVRTWLPSDNLALAQDDVIEAMEIVLHHLYGGRMELI